MTNQGKAFQEPRPVGPINSFNAEYYRLLSQAPGYFKTHRGVVQETICFYQPRKR